jgi:hypothetical protein
MKIKKGDLIQFRLRPDHQFDFLRSDSPMAVILEIRMVDKTNGLPAWSFRNEFGGYEDLGWHDYLSVWLVEEGKRFSLTRTNSKSINKVSAK